MSRFTTLLTVWTLLTPLPMAMAGPNQPLASEVSCLTWTDPQGIPHLKAQNELGAYTCMGYAHGRDRAWQMDLLRRTVQGKKSEILGFDSVVSDFRMRLLGLGEKARTIFQQMTPAQRAPLEAYARGVNRGFRTPEAKAAYEFKALGYEPEPWHPEDSIAMVLLQSFDQTRQTFQQDLKEADWKSALGTAAQDLYTPDGLPWDNTVLKPGEYQKREIPPALKSARLLPRSPSLDAAIQDIFPPDQGEGSNNWVLAPERSASHRAWMANDPHLALKHPPFWHWMHISGGKIDAIGASLPGVPVIPSGSNRNVAWGLTNAYLDVADVYAIPESELDAGITVRPIVWVKLFWKIQIPIFHKTFRRTQQGWPVLPVDQTPKGKALVLRWSGYDLEPSDLEGFFQVVVSQSSAEIDQAFSRIGVPSWNFVFADTHGAIGHRAVGKVPLRKGPPVFGILETSLKEIPSWKYLTPDEMPHVFKPARGYIATANNRHWPADAARHGGRGYAQGFRSFRIEELLLSRDKHDLNSIRLAQCDVQAVDARFLLPRLMKQLKRAGRAPIQSSTIEALEKWDFQAGKDCAACPAYRRWMDRLQELSGLNTTALYRALEKDPAEELKTQVNSAFDQALKDLGPESSKKAWGDYHFAFFPHLAGDNRFTATPIATPGDEFTVNPGTADWDASKGVFKQVSGASQRLIVEMTSPPTVHAVLAGSNRDIPDRDLNAKSGPWRQWESCSVEKRIFPLDWDQVNPEEVRF